LRSLCRALGSLCRSVVDALYTPPKRLYLRVNTFLIKRGELIDRLRERGIRAYPDPFVDEALYIVLEGPFRIEALQKKIVVNRHAAESILMGANTYAPGVVSYDPFRRGDTVTIMAPNMRPVAIGITVIDSGQLKKMKHGLVARTIKSVYSAPPIREMPEYRTGYFYPQSLPAMMVSKLMDPRPGQLIVDMNCSPGGKTSHVVQLTRGSARILGFDRNLGKVERVRETLTRLKLYLNTVLAPADTRYIDVDLLGENRADAVLIDPPCTGLGVRPKIEIRTRKPDLVNSYLYQRQFFRPAKKIVKPGGRIVYSTCTLTYEENEGNILYAVKEHGLECVDLGRIPYAEKLVFRDCTAYRFGPHIDDMPGFFISVLRKPSS